MFFRRVLVGLVVGVEASTPGTGTVAITDPHVEHQNAATTTRGGRGAYDSFGRQQLRIPGMRQSGKTDFLLDNYVATL